MKSFTTQLQAAADHLRTVDPDLAPLIQRVGLPTIQPHDDYFYQLVRAITSQQVSTKAAATIFKRLEDSFGGSLPDASEMAARPIEQLRAVGLSGRKASYVLDLATRVSDGRLNLRHIANLDDQTVIDELVAVKGLGVWSAQVFMLFCLGRPDILATGDLGIRAGVQKLCRLETLPSPKQVADISAERGWSPYQSAACWYLWRLLDDKAPF